MESRVATHPDMVRKHYEQLRGKLAGYRQALGRPLTLSEKNLFSHLQDDRQIAGLKRGESFILLRPDRVAMQDATAQMAMLQFIQSGCCQAMVPSTVHCDHLIRARTGADDDLRVAGQENEEVYNFLRSAASKYGIGFWGPGSGIIHQVVLENYAFPGGLMIGTDSHTPNAGGLGMLAIGVGGADAVDVMAGKPWELLYPKMIAIHLTGSMKGWTSPKDVILKVLEQLTVKGGTNKIIEYIGEGAASLSCTGKATIANMGAELGATTSVFACDQSMVDYLSKTGRAELAGLCQEHQDCLSPDPEVLGDLHKYYDEVLEINLDQLEPYIVGPHSPDLARPVSGLARECGEKGYPEDISACLIGSCTNSSYEDIYKAAEVAREAVRLGLRSRVPFYISPGSAQIFATIRRDGLLDALEAFGGIVLANACGPCIGQWKRDDIKEGEKNAIITSFNRNFRGRNDTNAQTLGFIASPEIVIACAVSGKLGFNPAVDKLLTPGGEEVLLTVPEAPRFPELGFATDTSGYQEPAGQGNQLPVEVRPGSKRLQLLEPFRCWAGEDFDGHLLLVKVRGKCTTDHISPAGTWLRFRGHLDHISDNMLLGAGNAFREKAGYGISLLSGEEEPLASIARSYKEAGKRWVIVGDENYGEGSSREHAAMSPRFLNASTVLVRSFARIHETNLKKQGILALTFADARDYEKVREGDRISIHGLKAFAPGKGLQITLKHLDGSQEHIAARHSYNAEQIEWFRAGSSLNLI